jgi:RNA polymerase sigma-70 factor (ECF subfamily)
MALTGQSAAEVGGDNAVKPFADAVRAHQGMVFSIAYHFLRDRQQAEEVAQDTFLQLYRHYGQMRDDSHVVFWLRKTASHRCIDAARSRGRDRELPLEEAPEPPASSETGDLLLNRRLRQLIGSLPEKPRLVMVLRYQEDLMPEEIAKVLDMPVRTVKSHLQRSLAMLREKLERVGGKR